MRFLDSGLLDVRCLAILTATRPGASSLIARKPSADLRLLNGRGQSRTHQMLLFSQQ